MGRGAGGGGGGRGGGGRESRGAGGGGEQKAGQEEILEKRNDRYAHVDVTQDIADAEKAAVNNPELLELSAYKDLPPIENANRKINAEGLVEVGSLGAPKIGTPTMTNAEAMKAFERMGLPRGTEAYENILNSGDANKLIQLFPEGSKFLGAGVEGAGFSLPGGRTALRIQHGGGKPLLQADVGKVGVYADWLQKYGSTYVEQKELVAMQGRFIGKGRLNAGGRVSARKIKEAMDRNIMVKLKKKVHTLDDHSGNWGIDYKGRGRVFDAGAYRPIGDYKVAAIWE